MNLTDLKKHSPADLMKIAEDMKIEHLGRVRKQDLIFKIAHCKSPKKMKTFLVMAY